VKWQRSKHKKSAILSYLNNMEKDRAKHFVLLLLVAVGAIISVVCPGPKGGIAAYSLFSTHNCRKLRHDSNVAAAGCFGNDISSLASFEISNC